MRIRNLLVLLTFVCMTNVVFASASRYLDGQYITNGAFTLTVPGITDTLVTLTGGATLTNKTMSGASNTFSNIPVGAIGGGSVLSGTNTGDVTLGTASGLSLSGQQLSLGLASSGITGALSGSDWTTFNGKLTSPLTTKGDILTHDATTNTRLGVGTNGYVLTANSGATNGVDWEAIPAVAPTLTGSQASPSLITAAGGIAFTGSTYNNIWFIKGSAGAVVVTATPQVAAGSSVGQLLTLIGEDGTNTVTFADSNGLALNGLWVGGLNSVLKLVWDGSVWVETSRR